MSGPAPAEAAPRAVRVFVSSTFRDMQAEREELVKRVFPQLRDLCESRGVTWGEVDLRWGVTDEQKADGLVLPICLAEIRRCRPYFLGLLGERYGWVPEGYPPEVVASEPWLAAHPGRSVTELEILHGVLNDPAMAGHAFFYLRDPDYLATLPAGERAAFLEGPTPAETAALGESEAERRAEARRRALAALKERIRASGLPVRDRVPDPVSLADLVLSDLTALIERLFPAGAQPDPLEAERARHQAFARTRADVYVGRDTDFERLDRHVLGEGGVLAVTGESGVGKSALLANWSLAFQAAHPERLVLTHFVGASGPSTEWTAMLRRLLGELERADVGTAPGSLPVPLPDTDALRAAFSAALERSARQRPILLVIDALDQLDDRDGALDLAWLPLSPPPGVALVVSTLAGRPLDELARRSCPTLAVAPLDLPARARLIERHLAQYTKSLDRARVERIAASPLAGSPLYLRALLEELRVWGDHLTLDRQIDAYLAVLSIDDLYQRILERWERDYERGRPGLVREAMTLLHASRRGLSEAELLDLLGSLGKPLPRAHWSPLYLAAERSLVSRGGLLSFFHPYLRRAVERRYLAGDTAWREPHFVLAGYFESRPPGDRRTGELPWQLQEARSWSQLADLLGDLDFLGALNRLEPSGPAAYWARVERESASKALHSYRHVLKDPRADPRRTWLVATVLSSLGYSQQALVAAEAVTDVLGEMGDTGLATTALLAQAGMRHTAGQPAEALRLVDQALIALRRAGDRDGELSALESRVRLLSTLGRRLEESEGLAELETLSRERGDARIQAECGVRRAQLLEDEGRSEEALGLLEPVERMARQSGNRELLVSCLHVRARVAQRRRDAREALAHWTEMERLLREAGNALRLAAVLMAQVPLLERDPATRDSALAKCREACFLYEITGRAVDLVNAKAALLRIERGFSWVGGLPVSVQRALSGLVSLAALAAGLALGLWSPWLWLLGGPLALVGVGNLLMTLFPRLHMRSVRLAERLSAEVCEEEVRRGGG